MKVYGFTGVLFCIILLGVKTDAIYAQTALNNIRCSLVPAKKIDHFEMPVRPVATKGWHITNPFGNKVKNTDVPGLPNGIWQHTGVDYLLNWSSTESQNRQIYAAAAGRVVFSTKTDKNPSPARGGLVILRHLAPDGHKITVAGHSGPAGSYKGFETSEVFTYYLHLDPDSISVGNGDEVGRGEEIARLYGKNAGFAYVPHLHLEIWSSCVDTELNGYEPDGTLQSKLKNPVIDPESFLSTVILTGSSPPKPVLPVKIPTLFLFDVSGSMSENDKIGQARDAGLDALREMKDAGSTPAGIMTFSGSCGGDVTRKLHGYSNDLKGAERVMRGGLPSPNGETPLPQAKVAAESDLLGYLGANPAMSEGRIILLSDGQSTCGNIRPPGVFSRQDAILSGRNASKIKYFTIGFDVAPGSAAERDLQYIASQSGGRYYNASNRGELISSLRKQVRRYVPVACSTGNADAVEGFRAFAESDYRTAATAFSRYSTTNPGDKCAQYNLALALEASDRYRGAGEVYQRYLGTGLSPAERARIESKVAEMQREYTTQFDYYIRLIESDKRYLDGFYDSIFNRKSSELGAEFDGFVYEKSEFYANLPDILEVNERWLANVGKDIASAMSVLRKRRSLPSFDRDALSLLPIGLVEDAINQLRDYQRRHIR